MLVDHEQATTGSETTRSFLQKGRHIWDMMEYIQHAEKTYRVILERHMRGIYYAIDPVIGHKVCCDNLRNDLLGKTTAGAEFNG